MASAMPTRTCTGMACMRFERRPWNTWLLCHVITCTHCTQLGLPPRHDEEVKLPETSTILHLLALQHSCAAACRSTRSQGNRARGASALLPIRLTQAPHATPPPTRRASTQHTGGANSNCAMNAFSQNNCGPDTWHTAKLPSPGGPPHMR